MSEDLFVTVDDLRLRCLVDGKEGAPWLVFSNSLMTDLSIWDAQVAAFGDRFRILRYDTRGHGGSDVPADAATFDGLVEDLRALLDHFGIARTAVAGVSMGGVTALGLALRHPRRVGHVAVCSCQPASTPAGAAAWEERIGVARAGGMQALVAPTMARWFHNECPKVAAMIAATPLNGFIHAARALQEYDFRPELAALRCPAALVVGAQDAALPVAMKAMADHVPHAVLTEIDPCGHLPNVEQPDRFNTALSALLAR